MFLSLLSSLPLSERGSRPVKLILLLNFKCTNKYHLISSFLFKFVQSHRFEFPIDFFVVLTTQFL